MADLYTELSQAVARREVQRGRRIMREKGLDPDEALQEADETLREARELSSADPWRHLMTDEALALKAAAESALY